MAVAAVADLDPAFYAQGLAERLAPLEAVLAELGRLRAQPVDRQLEPGERMILLRQEAE